MKEYNGHSPELRNKAQRWLNAQWASGALERPKQCCACGQDKGRIDAHAEDYSEPFAAGKTDAYHLCFICHMMVHCRFKSRKIWNHYRTAIRRGWRFPPLNSWPMFRSLYLTDKGLEWALQSVKPGEKPERFPLDEIEKAATRPLP